MPLWERLGEWVCILASLQVRSPAERRSRAAVRRRLAAETSGGGFSRADEISQRIA